MPFADTKEKVSVLYILWRHAELRELFAITLFLIRVVIAYWRSRISR